MLNVIILLPSASLGRYLVTLQVQEKLCVLC